LNDAFRMVFCELDVSLAFVENVQKNRFAYKMPELRYDAIIYR